MLRTTALTVLLCAPTLALAGGLSIPEPDAAALGRAGAAAAALDGPSAVYYNPAGVALGRGLALQVGMGIEDDRTRVVPSAGASSTATTVGAIPSFFVTQRIGDHYGIGFGVYRAPTQALSYSDAFTGRFHALRANLGGTTLAPTVAGRPFSWLSMGFGLTVTFAQADVSRAQGDSTYETHLRAPGHSVGIGASVGLWARLYREYALFGFSFRSSTDLDETSRVTTTAPGSSASLAVQNGKLTTSLPHQLSFAFASRPRPGTTLQLEARVALLRDLHGFNVTDTQQPPATIFALPLSLRQQVQLRLGAEQHLVRDHLSLRLGVGYDLGSARRDLDPAFPDGDRVVLAAGLGFHRSDVAIDAGYLVSFSPGTTGSLGHTYDARFESVRHVVALSLSVRIGSVGPKPKRFAF